MSHDGEQNVTLRHGVVSDATFREMFGAVVDVTITLDADGEIQAVVDDASALGYASEQLSGDPITTVLAEDDLTAQADVRSSEEFESLVVAAEMDGTAVPVRTADGTVRQLELWTVPRPEADGPVCFGRVFGDASRTTRATTARRRLDAVPDPLCVLDSDGRFDRVNDALVAYTGYDRDELLGRSVAELLPPSAASRSTANLLEVVTDDAAETTTFEVPLVNSDGERVLTEANVAPLTDGASGVTSSVCVLRDVRERERRERDLDLLNRVLTRVLRHNVRNELVTVEAHAELLERQVDDSLREHPAKILDAADRLLGHGRKARRIQDVVESGGRRDHELREFVRAATETVRDEFPEATIETDLPAEAVVRAHPAIEDAIEELLDNAVRHTPETDSAHVEVWLDRRDGGRTLFVEDESGGLSDYEIDVLENGTETDLEHGAGVGLWLVRWLVRYSDAELIVHRTDEGSLIGIRFGGHTPSREAPAGVIGSSLGRAPPHLRDASPQQFRGDTIIGRAEPLTRLEELYGSLEDSGGHSVLVTGEAGIGKTTLVERFRETVGTGDEPPLFATGFCEPEVQPAYNAFRGAMGDLPTDRDVSDILTNAASLSAEDSAELQQRRRSLFAEVATELRQVARDRPVVVLVEDMQWADRGTVDLFEYLVDEVGRWGHPVMFLGTYRTSDVAESHPVLETADEIAAAGRGTVIELDPFGVDEIDSLLSHMLDVEALPEGFAQAVVDHTGGTPLFVHELGRQFVDASAPVRSGAELPADLTGVAVPETVESAVAERFESLPEEVRPVLRLGAVIGREFSFELLRAASDQSTGRLVESIDTLVGRDVWERSADGVAFVHGLVREQLLGRLSEQQRETLHVTVATAIETVHEDDLETHAGRLGHHYERASEHETALEYFRRAGDHAVETFANDAAISHYERALELAQDHGVARRSTRAALLEEIGGVFERRAEHERARQYHEESLELSRELGDRQGEANSLDSLGNIAESRGAYDRATECCEEGLALFRECGDREGEASCLDTLGNVARNRGEYEQARQYHEESLELAQELGDRQSEASSLNSLGAVAYHRDALDRAEECYERSLALKREIGDRGGESNTLNNLGVLVETRGAYDRAEQYYEESLELARELGDRQSEASSFYSLGILADKQGAYDRAEQHYEKSLALAREIGYRKLESMTLDTLGTVAANRGEYEQARQYHEEGLELAQELGDRQGEAVTLSNLGDVSRRCGAYDRAEQQYEESLSLRRELGDRTGEANSLIDLAAVARRRGRTERARRLVADAREITTEVENTRVRLRSLYARGAVARQLDTDDDPATYLDEALAVTDTDELRHERATVRLERGRLALDRGNTETAREALEQAYEVFSELGAAHFEARATVLRGRLAARTGSPDEARDRWRDALDTFEDVGAPQDALETLSCLVETCRRQNETAQADRYEAKAEAVSDRAPDPVRECHGAWLDR
jgi:PAS domain S-box-containing protein